MATIEFRIKKGKVSIEVSGVEDASCREITQALENALGEVEDVQEKPQEYVELDHMELYETDEQD